MISLETGDTTFRSINWGRADEQLLSGLDYRNEDIIHTRCAAVLRGKGSDMTVIKQDAAEWTGGCQCGAVRYQLLTPPEHACICHCRMCQRASGQPFMAFASVKRENLRWTRGHPSTFVSSNVAERNFCNVCGTPLTYNRVESGSIAVTIGSLDAPEAVRPIEQFGIESELSWISGLRALPAKRTEDWKREYSILHIDSHQYLPVEVIE